METNNDNPDITDRNEILDFAAYLIKQDTIEDDVNENGVYNIDSFMAYQFLLDAMKK